jgi:hypothetical protein
MYKADAFHQDESRIITDMIALIMMRAEEPIMYISALSISTGTYIFLVYQSIHLVLNLRPCEYCSAVLSKRPPGHLSKLFC